MTKKKKTDNSFMELKLLIRKRLIKHTATGTAVDMFSGNGKMLSRAYSGFNHIYAVEKNADKIKELHSIQQGQKNQRIEIFQMNNNEFINRVLPGIENIDLFDFDAYGNPNLTIKKALEIYNIKKPLAIAVTDGARMNIVRGGMTRPESYFPFSGGPCANKRRPIKFQCKTQKGYELLIRNFWEELSVSQNFKITDSFLAWKQKRMVLYYGLIIRPN